MFMKVLRILFVGSLVLVAIPANAASDRNWLFRAQFGGYTPHVDDELTATPFADTFGSHARLLSQASIERYVFQDLGTLGFGVSAGYSEFFGKGFFEGTDERSPGSTSFHIVPVTVFADYRFDYPAMEWGLPLVPYGKAGIGGWIFWINDTHGDTAGDGAAKGVRWGYTLSGGLALQLDFFDPHLSNEFDRDYGVNNSYLYADFTHAVVTSFGRRGFDLSDDIVSGGIAFEF